MTVEILSVEEFQTKAHAWLVANVPPAAGDDSGAESTPDMAAIKSLQHKIFEAGFTGITWPVEYGGQGLTDDHLLAWNTEAAAFAVPQIYGIGFGMCGPTILDLGTHEQKERYIREMLYGDVIWCQLFSEPGAGSDVAGLRTKAERDGDEWVVNGQKVWTSGAHYSDHAILLARTDPDVPKHNGLTMFIVDMHAPGVTVRPLRQATGESPFNEVFLDNVRLPGDSVVGDVNGGWAAAVLLLRHERLSIGRGPAGGATRLLGYDAILGEAQKAGRTSDTLARDRLASLYAVATAGTLLNARMRQEADEGIELRARGSISKLAAAVVLRQSIDFIDEILGQGIIAWRGDALPYPETTHAIVQAPSLGIAGGSNEIQRGIIGERVLGLAKEPQLDREIPFNDIRVMVSTKPPTR